MKRTIKYYTVLLASTILIDLLTNGILIHRVATAGGTNQTFNFIVLRVCYAILEILIIDRLVYHKELYDYQVIYEDIIYDLIQFEVNCDNLGVLTTYKGVKAFNGRPLKVQKTEIQRTPIGDNDIIWFTPESEDTPKMYPILMGTIAKYKHEDIYILYVENN